MPSELLVRRVTRGHESHPAVSSKTGWLSFRTSVLCAVRA